jgi:hypothetical protein
MTAITQSRFGRALYEALPEIYRTRDGRREDEGEGKNNGDGHLAAYLDSCGKLLDAVYNSLDQRYRDCFPETCQEWLLPYFAELVGAATLSPHAEGRRMEIMNAVAWRQGKGSLTTVRDIAEKMGCFENPVVREGWRRVARTARTGGPSVSPAVTDLRGKGPKDFTGHRNTAPHFVDVRKPDWNRGHAHPRAILIYAPPYPGFFAGKEVVSFQWRTETTNGTADIDSWFKKTTSSISPGKFIGLKYDSKTNTWFFHKKSGVREIIRIEGGKKMNGAARYRFSELNLEGKMSVTTGSYLILEKLAARDVYVANNTKDTPLSGLIATDCLLQDVKASNSLVRLEYCTVLKEMFAEELYASDCVFMGTLYRNASKSNPPVVRAIRYSRHGQESAFGGIVGNTTERPVFYTREWGAPMCGVMHPSSSEAIYSGAEDGGEMGAFHHRAYALAWEAVVRKINDCIPVGMRAALIPDETLRQ